MLVTGLPSIVTGIINAPDAFLSQPVIVAVSPWISYSKLGLKDTAAAGSFPAMGSSGSTSSLVAVWFSLGDRESSGDDFSPQLPRRRGSDIDNRSAHLIPSTMPVASASGHYKRGTRLHRPPASQCRNHGAVQWVKCKGCTTTIRLPLCNSCRFWMRYP